MTGVEIFRLLPQKNCKECGSATCLAFAMSLAASKVALELCPYASDECKEILGSATAPPIKLVKVGAGEKVREMGEEIALFRHDKAFVHPTSYAIQISDQEADFAAKVEKINSLSFERVGQHVSIDMIALKDDSKDPDIFAKAAEELAEKSKYALIFMSENPTALDKALEKALSVCEKGKPLLYAATEENWEPLASLAKKYNVPLAVKGNGIQATSDLVEKIAKVTQELIIDTGTRRLSQTIAELTQIRRLAVKKKYRPFGYPTMAIADSGDLQYDVLLASAYTAKYASMVIMKADEKSQLLPLVAWRMNLYTDPQKPSQVEPGIYAIGEATKDSPVFVTTNFSLTFYSVEGEISVSKVPAWLIAAPTDGTSVLTAYAAGKFTGENVANFMKEIDVENKVSTREITIPGYVAVMKGVLEEKSGWKVRIAPSEASGLRAYTKTNFG